MEQFIKKCTAGMSIVTLLLFAQIVCIDSRLASRYYTEIGTSLSLQEDHLSLSTVPRVSTASLLSSRGGVAPVAQSSGEKSFWVNLYGIIPVKQVTVKPIESPTLSISGRPFGLKMFTSGAIIVGFSEIEAQEGRVSPGQKAGLKEGDLICSINKKTIERNEEVALLIEKSEGKPMVIEVEREGKRQSLTFEPVFCTQDNSYKGGIWVRDSAAGIGTISFIDPKTGVFAGLGHPICDVDTGKVLPLGSGEICDVSIREIEKGESGNPGELIGIFQNTESIGEIRKNNQSGVYGKLYGKFPQADIKDCKSYPMAFKQEVVVGPAQILCTLEGTTPTLYDVQITSIDYSEQNEIKNMVIKITDPTLIELTGGIVQGMSGTPMVQNEKLVGIVTHVFVNNACKGYAIFAENMYRHATSVAS